MSLQLWDDALSIQRRLEALGLPAARRLVLHANRTVMVSQARGGAIRLHRGYVYAPDRVLRAIVTFLTPRSPRVMVRRAERELLAFPVEEFVPVEADRRRCERARPGDERILSALCESHRRLNRAHFGGALSQISFRLSGRMRSRLGELVLDDGRGQAREIAISRRHIRRDGWEEVEQTLLHEMVHQWQAEGGLPVDHGASFRNKARQVGVEPSAKRQVMSKRKAARY
ncbi:MAG: SprT-like domain-containing protein [Gemmatimonadetes bacterium]|nr:SprT-like domain-containing protein [Gemmatimonadota bacterium]